MLFLDEDYLENKTQKVAFQLIEEKEIAHKKAFYDAKIEDEMERFVMERDSMIEADFGLPAEAVRQETAGLHDVLENSLKRKRDVEIGAHAQRLRAMIPAGDDPAEDGVSDGEEGPGGAEETEG